MHSPMPMPMPMPSSRPAAALLAITCDDSARDASYKYQKSKLMDLRVYTYTVYLLGNAR